MSTFSNSIPRTPPPFEPSSNEEEFIYSSNRKRPAPYEPSSKRSYQQSPPFNSHNRHGANDFEGSNTKTKFISIPYSLLIPNELIGFLIGTGGSVIREIENNSSSILYFEKSGYPSKTSSPNYSDNNANNHENNSHSPKQSNDDQQQEEITDKILTIFGNNRQKDTAVDLILRRIKSLRPLQDTDEKDAIIIGLPSNSLCLLIGHKGATINDISRRSHCEIIVQKKNLNIGSAKAVSIRSSDVSGLVNCISAIYNTFELFAQQGKLQQEDFVLLQDEKAKRYAREVSESLANESKIKHSPANLHADIPFYNRGMPMNQYKRNLSPSPSRHRMMHEDNFSYRSSPSRSGDKPVKYHFGEKLPFPMVFKEPPFRDDSHDMYPNPQAHKHQDFYDNDLDPPNYNRQGSNKARRKGYSYGDHDLHNSPRYNGKNDLNSVQGDGHPGALDSAQPFPISPYSQPRMNYPSRASESSPIHNEHLGNLLNHQFSQYPTQYDIKFVVQADTAAWVVGKKGDHIKEAKRHTGADISVSDAKTSIPGLEADERLLTVSGSILAKFRTFEILISPMLARIANTNKSVRLLLPTKSVSFVIGLGGATINQITHESKAEVNVEKSLLIDGDRPVTISGTPNSQLAASLLLFEKVEEFHNPEISEKNLRIPLIPLSYNSPIHHPPYNSSHHSNYNSREGMSSSRDGPTPHYVH